MAQKKGIQPLANGVGDVEESTKAVLVAVFENLKNNANVKGEGPTRLFFPNGIELISLIVKVNLKDGVDVEIKIAGEKGVKGTALVQGESAEKSEVVSLREATN
jgi:hypothetical protein